MNIEKIKQMLLDEEGYRQNPYFDTKGFLTNGIGNNLTAQGINATEARKRWPNGISMEEAMQDVETKVLKIIASLKSILQFFNALDEVRQAVLIDMAFNMGVTKLMGFKKMLDFASQGDWINTAHEMWNSKWTGDVGTTRSSKLYKMMLNGEWP